MAQGIVAAEIVRLEAKRSSGLAGELEASLVLGFRRVKEYLSLEVSAGDAADATEELKRKQAALTSELIRTQARLDDTALRSEREDRFLEIIERANMTLPPPEVDE